MPVEMIGWIAPRVSSELIPPSGPPFDAEVIAETARIHERAGFDRVLIGYFSDAPDGFLVGAHAASVTERLGFLLGASAGVRGAAGRRPQAGDPRPAQRRPPGGAHHRRRQRRRSGQGRRLDRPRRPAIAAPRSTSSLLRRTWTEPAPFDHEGEFYRTRGTYSEIRCRQQPHIPIYGGGGSDAAIRALAPHVDVYMLWGEPLKDTALFMDRVRQRGGALRPQPDLQPVDPPDPGGNRGRSLGPGEGHPRPGAGQPRRRAARRSARMSARKRLLQAAAEAEVHDTCLWTSLAAATGAQGNSTALVGTPETVAKALLEYYKLGATSLLIRGYDPRPDAVQYGEELIPRLRELVADHDAATRFQ